MKAAIMVAEAHQTPFGAALALGDQLYVTAANQTKELHDPTAHAEVMAIRKLGERIKKTDMSGFTLYTTCEPCPMCMSAAIWARIETVFFGCSISQISKYMDQIDLESDAISQKGFYRPDVEGGVMEEQCIQLLEKFS